ncbi:unnamed protein product [Staurois parvus]|uniref:Uncharacterized protein n=1 Tax=Staurois parvus TaxID=386267 RepID=A0ABN9B8J8_9NEOB|nr:unnamed protein product [Staurois parvus]
MHSPKKKQLSSSTHQTEHVQLSPEPLFYQKKGRIRGENQTSFLHNAED